MLLKNLLTVFWIVVCIPCIAQKMALKISPQHLVLSIVKIELEASLKPNMSILFSPAYANYYSISEQIEGAGIETGFRMYFNSDSLRMRGYYAQCSFHYRTYNRLIETLVFSKHSASSTNSSRELIDLYGIDCLVGQQIFWKKRISADLYAGIGFRYGGTDRNPTSGYFNIFDFGYSGPVPKVGIKIGWILY